jgi:Trk K+ transport system NAD-binding subunit
MGEPLAHRVATEGACVAVVDIDAEEAERTAGQRR